MGTFWQDVRYSLRMLSKSPGFTAVVVLTLALGIGITTAMFTIVHGVLLRALPFPNADELVLVNETEPSRDPAPRFDVAILHYLDLRERGDVFAGVAAFRFTRLVWTGGDEPQRLSGYTVSANLFDVVGVAPLLGRGFQAADSIAGAEKVTVLSYALWQSRFEGDPGALGRAITLNEVPHTIVGVMPPLGAYPRGALWTAWVPEEDPQYKDRYRGGVSVLARRKHGVSFEQAASAMTAQSEQLAQYDPSLSKRRFLLTPLHEDEVGSVRAKVWALAGAVGFVLLIACVNVANLLLVRATSRQQEMVVRAALGAGRGRLVRQSLTESLLLALMGGAGGIALAYWGLALFKALEPPGIPRIEEVSVGGIELSFALGLSVVSVLLAGVVPALRASRVNVVEGLKQGILSAGRQDGKHARAVLVVAEVALALVLLSGAGLTVRSFLQLQNVELGFEPRNLLTVFLHPGSTGTWSPITTAGADVQGILDDLRALPGVKAASVSGLVPLDGSTSFTMCGEPEGAAADRRRWYQCEYVHADPGYFPTMGIPVLRGREFLPQDTSAAAPVAIVSERFARIHWPNQDPIGKSVRVMIDPAPREIVGVVGDARYSRLADDYRPKVYVPSAQGGVTMLTFLVRTEGDPRSLIPAIKDRIWAAWPTEPIERLRTAEELYARWLVQPRFYAALFGLFAGLAVALAAIGLFGVVSYSVRQRTREIGVRMALGAQRGDILVMVLKHTLALILVGVAAGLGGALALTRFIQSFLFGVVATDTLTLSLMALLLVALALLAGLLPARRASRVDPLVALRYE